MQRGLRVRGVLLDLSGTLHVEDSPTPRAVEAMARSRESHMTQTTSRDITSHTG